MEKQLFILIIIFSTLAPLCFADAVVTQQLFSKRYEEGMVKGQPELFRDMFAEDIKVLPEYDKAFLGKARVASYYAAIFEQYTIRALQRTAQETLDIGERKVEIGTFTLQFTPTGREEVVTLPGTYLEVWDVSGVEAKLVTMAWNYDKHIDGMENIFRARSHLGEHYAFQPTAAINSPISFEVAATHNFVTTLMLRKQPETLAIRFAEDGWFAPHGLPIQKGKAAMTKHLIEYAKNWPAFDFIDVNTNEIYVHGDYTLEHFSYNLRWRTLGHSGVVIGKGIRIAKRNDEGVLQVYRSIPMHD